MSKWYCRAFRLFQSYFQVIQVMVWSQLAVPGDAPRLDDNNDGDGDGGIKEYRADDSFRLYVK